MFISKRASELAARVAVLEAENTMLKERLAVYTERERRAIEAEESRAAQFQQLLDFDPTALPVNGGGAR